jgi:hypothetical protein
MPASVVRVDETLAFFEDPTSGQDGETYVTSLIATYRINPSWVPLIRVSLIHNSPPGAAPSAGAVSNPLVGVTYLHPLSGGWRWTGFLASTIPIGSGGGDTPDTAKADAQSAATPVRSAMEGSLFAVNYWAAIGGLGLARITQGLTLQAEVTVFQMTRVRGPETQDKSRTSLTAGLHVGHFFSPRLSFGADLRMQRWMTDAAPALSDPSAREQFTLGLGPRFHFKLDGNRWLRPGISYTRALDDPMKGKGYNILQLDFPLAF